MASEKTPLGYLERTLGEADWAPFQPAEIAKGSTWVRQGGSVARLSLLRSGRMDVFLETKDGRVLLGRKRAGDWVGEMGIISPGPASATVQATMDCSVLTLDRTAYEGLRERRPRAAGILLAAICRDLARRIRKTTASDLVVRPGKASLLVPRLKALAGVRRGEDEGLDWLPARRRPGKLTPAAVRSLLTGIRGLDVLKAPPGEGAEYVRSLKRDVEILGPYMRLLDLKDGETILREGERSDGVYLILKGGVHVVGGRPSSWFHVDRTMGPGELFGLVAFFDDGTRSATVTATGTTRLAVIYPVVVRRVFLDNAETGGGVGVHALEWFAGQLVSDARALNQRILAALGAPRG